MPLRDWELTLAETLSAQWKKHQPRVVDGERSYARVDCENAASPLTVTSDSFPRLRGRLGRGQTAASALFHEPDIACNEYPHAWRTTPS